MSQQKDLVQKWSQLFNQRDWNGILPMLTDDFERWEYGAPPIVGKQAFAENMVPGPEVTSMQGENVRLTEEGNVVVAEGIVRLGLKDGSALKIYACSIFEFEGDKIKRQLAYTAVDPPPDGSKKEG